MFIAPWRARNFRETRHSRRCDRFPLSLTPGYRHCALRAREWPNSRVGSMSRQRAVMANIVTLTDSQAHQATELFQIVELAPKRIGYLRESRVFLGIYRPPSGHCPIDLDVFDLIRIHVVRVLFENDEVGQLAGGNRSF